MKLYLYNQTRNRELEEYQQKLNISSNDFLSLNTPTKKLLLVGGGLSPIQPDFSKTSFDITNIDFAPSKTQTKHLHQITGNFLETSLQSNYFDEAWALYSLPLYAQNRSSIYLFIAKSLLALVQGGKLRIFPLEFCNDPKLKTRDAEWEITTQEVTDTTVTFLSELEKYNVLTTYIVFGKSDEKAAIVSTPTTINEKLILNEVLCNIIRENTKNKLSKPEIYI